MKERFLNYVIDWDSTKYNYSILEQIVYDLIVMLIGLLVVLGVIVLTFTSPIWGLPYLIWKNNQLKKKEKI